jgi:hypothetical protein
MFVLDGGPLTIPGTVRREPIGTESMWAEVCGGGRYRLRNSPFYAYGVSFLDVVVAEHLEGQLTVTRIILRGGHSTYRLKLADATTQEEFLRRWAVIEALGCNYEGGNRRLYAVDIKPEADIHAVYRELERGENEGVWIFEEAHCGHAV